MAVNRSSSVPNRLTRNWCFRASALALPDHGHSGPPAVAVERGGGLYEVDGLVLPMPALYEITLSATATSSATSSVVLSICIGVASG